MKRGKFLTAAIIAVFVLAVLCAGAVPYSGEEIRVSFEIENYPPITAGVMLVGDVIGSPSFATEILEEGQTAVWRIFGSDEIVEFPYTLREEDAVDGVVRFIGEIVTRVCTVTIAGCGGQEEYLYINYGEEPNLPQLIFGHAVFAWYSDCFETEYRSGAVFDDFTLYPLFSDLYVSVTVDGETEQYLYGAPITPLENTDTHDFIGYFYESGEIFDGRVLSDTVLFSRFERTRYRIEIEGVEGVLYIEKGEEITFDTVAEFGEFFFFDAEKENEVAFPFTPNDDTVLYIGTKKEEPSTGNQPSSNPVDTDTSGEEETQYSVTVDCPFAELNVNGYYTAGEIVEFYVENVSDGYVVDKILVECEGEIVVTDINDNAACFIMPEGNVVITVLFNDVSEPKLEINGKTVLTDGEITAIVFSAVLAVVLLVYISRKHLKSAFMKMRRSVSKATLHYKEKRFRKQIEEDSLKENLDEEDCE